MHNLYTALRLLVALSIASVIGLGGTLVALDADAGTEAVAIGPWVAHLPVGIGVANPYTRAVLARSGAVPLAATESIVLTARHDSEGRPLRPECDYVLASARIDSRWWTLTLSDTDGNVIGEPETRHAFNSANVLRASDGSFTVVLSPRAAPGNWLPSAGAHSAMLKMRLYDTGLYTNGGLPEASLPSITRGECA